MTLTRRSAYALLIAVAALPRLGVLLYERGDILASFTEKSDDFARTFVESGTFGFIPDLPSASTQPLYGFFLVAVYWIAGRAWWAIGLAQIALAAVTAVLVYELGRRWLSERAAVLAAAIATLSPYLVWHDVHVNREIVDQPLAVAVALLVLEAARRRSPALAAFAGAAAGAAVLGNSRLAALPLLLAGFLWWSLGRRALLPALAALVAAAVVVTPWVVRNRVEIGCFALTTDAKALWKANNDQTRGILSRGGWIDDVESPRGAPPTPEMAGGAYRANGDVVRVDECAQMDYYQGLVADFWREQPGEKAALAVQAAGMLWAPRTTSTEGRPGAGTWLDTARAWVAPAYALALYLLALFGARRVPRPLLVLTVALLAYQTLAAMIFAGATRYRVPWDFLLALLAAAALERFLPPRASD